MKRLGVGANITFADITGLRLIRPDGGEGVGDGPSGGDGLGVRGGSSTGHSSVSRRRSSEGSSLS